MQISVVIPTKNRRSRLVSLLESLQHSSLPLQEIIIADASDEQLQPSDYIFSLHPNIVYLPSESSVCIQRNLGTRAAVSPWVFLCDDDVEVPADYLQKIAVHAAAHPEAGAISGLFLQPENGTWAGSYPVTSAKELIWKYIFLLSIWGEIRCRQNNFIIRAIKGYYLKKGNHISKAGWPVITDLSGAYVTVPAYTLGASVVRKEWLLATPYDEVLDKHGIGDNYGVATDFPDGGFHLLNDAFVYHHHEPVNRLQKPLQYYRRVLALDYFTRTKKSLQYVKRRWLLWSLLGNAILFFITRDKLMTGPAFKTFRRVLSGNNPYYEAAKQHKKVTEPML